MATTDTWLKTALIGRELVADRTMSFRFERPADWSYRAGQSVDMTLLNPPETDDEGNLRPFTISAAPSEHILQITTRLRDTAFKRVLQKMPIGTEVKVEGPFGDFRLHRAARPAVLLAGGIGITPFRSMLVEATTTGTLPYRVFLFHANRYPADAAFADEMHSLALRDSNLSYVPTMTAHDLPAGVWQRERGHIDGEMIRRHAASEGNPIYYIAGPIGMVKGLRAMLLESGVDEDDVRSEEFTGY
jgi:ferredoxin-NADP reductase